MLTARPPSAFADIVRENLHVAREHDEFGLGPVDELEQLRLLGRLRRRRHRQHKVGDSMPVRDRAHVRVVRDDRRDVHAQLADPLSVQEILEAVIQLGHEDHHAPPVRAVVHLPLHLFGLRECHEVGAQPFDVDRLAGDPAEGHADEKPPGHHVVELVHLHDVQPMAREKAGDRGGRAHAARAGGGQDVGVRCIVFHGLILQTARASLPVQMRRRLMRARRSPRHRSSGVARILRAD